MPVQAHDSEHPDAHQADALRVLVVDDSAVGRVLVEAALTELGHVCETARGEHAAGADGAQRPGVVGDVGAGAGTGASGPRLTRARSPPTWGSASSRRSITRNQSGGTQASGNMPK